MTKNILTASSKIDDCEAIDTSCVINFIIYILRNTHQKAMSQIFVRKLVLANQRSERCFSHVKKMIRPIRSNRGVGVSRQNSRLLFQLAAPLRTHSTRKVLLKEFFSLKKLKNISEMEWNSFVCFTVDKEKGMSRRNNSGKGKTERDVSFCCTFCRSYFAFHLCLSLY